MTIFFLLYPMLPAIIDHINGNAYVYCTKYETYLSSKKKGNPKNFKTTPCTHGNYCLEYN